MAETVHIEIPDDEWTNVSAIAGHDGLATNSGNNTLIYVQASAQPDAESTLGHRVDDDKVFTYNVTHPVDLWVRALHKPSIISITPCGDISRVTAGQSDTAIDALGLQKVSQDFSLFHSLFTFDVPASLWLIEENDVEVPNSLSTKATSVDGYANITSGATAGDSTALESRRHPRYQPSRGVKWAASVAFKGASLDGILRAGFINEPNDGVYLQTEGDGLLYLVVNNDGVEDYKQPIAFPFDIDITLGNIYDIQMQWRGVGAIAIFAGNPTTGHLEEVHKAIFLDTLDEKVFVRDPAMAAGYYAENVTQEVSMWSGCVDISTEGGNLEREVYGEVSTSGSFTATEGMIALRNPGLAPNGKINTRDLRLVRVTVTVSGRCTIKGYQTRDTGSVTGGTWSAVRTGSFVEGNTTFTAIDLTNAEKFTTIRAPANSYIEKTNPFAETIEFIGVHGDYLLFVLTDGNNITVDISVEWGEQL